TDNAFVCSCDLLWILKYENINLDCRIHQNYTRFNLTINQVYTLATFAKHQHQHLSIQAACQNNSEGALPDKLEDNSNEMDRMLILNMNETYNGSDENQELIIDDESIVSIAS